MLVSYDDSDTDGDDSVEEKTYTNGTIVVMATNVRTTTTMAMAMETIGELGGKARPPPAEILPV